LRKRFDFTTENKFESKDGKTEQEEQATWFATRYDLALRSGMIDYAEKIDQEWHGKSTCG
jgi:hypothetical protein